MEKLGSSLPKLEWIWRPRSRRKRENRFADEHNHVKGKIWRHKPLIRLCHDKIGSGEIIPHDERHTNERVVKHYKSGVNVAKDMSVSVMMLVDTISCSATISMGEINNNAN